MYLLDKLVDNLDELAILADKYNAIRGLSPKVLSTAMTKSQTHQSNKTVGIANQETKLHANSAKSRDKSVYKAAKKSRDISQTGYPDSYCSKCLNYGHSTKYCLFNDKFAQIKCIKCNLIGNFAKGHFPDRRVQLNAFVQACRDNDCANKIDVPNFVEQHLEWNKAILAASMLNTFWIIIIIV